MKPGRDYCPSCGEIFAGNGLPRSPKQHRAFFRMVALALRAWPDSYEYQPRGLTERQRFEDLRAWLICKAGHRVCILRFSKKELLEEAQLLAHYRAIMGLSRETPTFPAEDDNFIYFIQPKTINWKECGHEDFRPVFDEVLFIVEEITKLKIEFIKQKIGKLK